ncbi:phosphatidylinositol mannoside acyltransferase [Demequina zhanjiangensis]|uniref:Phosphatidylinositol mannoside acyltransferase n=1 Tax=Demequina zhanjiangensis TaxID=3051659 RepID=A0ABT8G0U7_9MICO|nr:phosphatidylinositol mannoside acyltransferase [Demequina sp. SYSU T00b26]MDN4472760.1 phosphatidylinositol mannoside acyltransferase [Demequina sp. SYSU T00b26]
MNSFLFAWRASRRLPVAVVRGAAWTLAMAAWATHAKASTRLEDNLARVTGASGRELRVLSRRGLASVARYYAEVLEMSRLTGDVIDARVRVEGLAETGGALSGANPAVAVLGHCGNWDLIGAWACRNLMPVTAVAEKLKPQEVFDEFVALRSAHGLRILGHEGGSTFRALLRIAREEPVLVCLVADRDLSGSGIPVEMWGHRVKVAPGPAALSLSSGAPLVPVHLRYERLRGARRRKARSAWGTVLSFGPVLEPADFTGEQRVEEMTQAWAASFADAVAADPQDWHMLQRFGWLEDA